MPREKRAPIPASADFVDLFCGDGRRILQLARAHPGKTFIGVDKKILEYAPGEVPQNVHFVKQDVMAFLRGRKYGGRFKVINADFGIGLLKPENRPEFYQHLKQLLHPTGRVYFSTYDDGTNVWTGRVKSEAIQAGFKPTHESPITKGALTRSGASSSSWGLTNVHESAPITRLGFRVRK